MEIKKNRFAKAKIKGKLRPLCGICPICNATIGIMHAFFLKEGKTDEEIHTAHLQEMVKQWG